MNTFQIVNESRRGFIKAGAGLTLGLYLPSSVLAAEQAQADAVFAPNAFVRVGLDNSVTVVVKHIEFGQGTFTGLPVVVADEMDASLEQIHVESAPADPSRYNNLQFGPFQGTGGSSSMANSFAQLRQAGATARAMLVTAAAQQWQIPESGIGVAFGVISHPDGEQKISFGELANKAATLPVPQKVALKNPKDFVYIGRMIPRFDNEEKITGRARFTQDVRMPNMLTAVVAHPPRFGATVASFDDKAARQVPGVVDVVQIETGIAVLGKDFWSVKKGRDALKVQWDESRAFSDSTPQMISQYNAMLNSPGLVAATRGSLSMGFAKAKKKLSADYVFPYLAHATMEPMNCVIQLGQGSCEVWTGSQIQTADQINLAKLLNIKPEQVKINTLLAGGSFGRRGNPQSDFTMEAARIAVAISGRAPVKLVWTREDDMQAGYFRPLYVHRIEAGLDDKGNVTAWHQRIVGQSIVSGTLFEGFIKDGIDPSSVEGAANLPYAIDDLTVDLHTTKNQVPVLFWRSVGSTHTAFSTETMIDELAIAAKKDPVAFRRAMLKDKPRHRGVLDLAAAKAGWDKPLARGKNGGKRGRGVAVHESFKTYVAQVVEVTVHKDNSYSVDRVVCAVDCGLAITPDVIMAQMEGGIAYGLSAALHTAITLKDGKVEQSNFDTYQPLRMNEMPKIEVYIVDTDVDPTGVGEPGTPVVAPALANALFAATGKRLRHLPLSLA